MFLSIDVYECRINSDRREKPLDLQIIIEVSNYIAWHSIAAKFRIDKLKMETLT